MSRSDHELPTQNQVKFFPLIAYLPISVSGSLNISKAIKLLLLIIPFVNRMRHNY